MSTEPLLLEQNQALRRQLQLQRQRIARLLDQSSQNGGFPRSMTMRLISQRPALAMRLASQLALLALGPRRLGALGSVLIVGRLLGSLLLKSGLPPADDNR